MSDEVLHGLIAMLFPDFDRLEVDDSDGFAEMARALQHKLHLLMQSDPTASDVDSAQTAKTFFQELPNLQKQIAEDVKAMYDGDPAARSEEEIIRCYPGFLAIASYRIAHGLHLRGFELLARIFTEVAHAKTGIDIHPGARIGSHFCIDHGTGVVIGETSEIGEWVKIYQGVTLGGLSVDKADARKKRHPSIEDHVVIYSGATILGGETVVGHHSIIGGNVWLTRSVKPHTKVYYKAAMSHDDGSTDTIEYRES